MIKYVLFGLLTAQLIYGHNMPLQLEIGLVSFQGLQGGKRSVQEITFEQPFTNVPQVAVALTQFERLDNLVYFSRVTNITLQGFMLEVLSGSQINLEYRYMAIVDDRVQINCMNFKVKDKVFLQFAKPYLKVPHALALLTGMRKGNGKLNIQQSTMKEGVMLTIKHSDAQVLGVCVIAGSYDSMTFQDDDIPRFIGFVNMDVEAFIGVVAQTSLVCDDECSAYYSKTFNNIGGDDIMHQNTTATNSNNLRTTFNVKPIQQPIELDNTIQINQTNHNTSQWIQIQPIQLNINASNNIANESINIQSVQQQPSIEPIQLITTETTKIELNNTTVSLPLSTITTIETQQNNKDDGIKVTPAHSKKQDKSNNKRKNQKPQIQKPQSIDKTPQNIVVPKKDIKINMREQFAKLERIALDQTQSYLLDPLEQGDISQAQTTVAIEEQSKGEKLMNLKAIERAPKLNPKIQEMLDQAKSGKHVAINNQEIIQHQQSQPIQPKYESLQSIASLQLDGEPNPTAKLMQSFTIKNSEQPQSQYQAEDMQLHFKTPQQQEKQEPILPQIIQSEESQELQDIQVEQRKQKQQPSKQVQESIQTLDNHIEQQKLQQLEKQNKPARIFTELKHNGSIKEVVNSSVPHVLTPVSSELQESQIGDVKLIKQEVPSYKDRIHQYLEKAEHAEINLINSQKVVEKVEEMPISKELNEAITEHINLPLPGEYIEILNQRKSQILEELKQKYKVKPTVSHNPQIDFSSFVQTENFPTILYDKYLDQLKKQPTRQPMKPIVADNSDEQAYQFEAAFVEWTLHNNDK